MKRIRRCKTCGCDISNRYIQTQRCLKCSVAHDRRMERLRRRRRAERALPTPSSAKATEGKLTANC